MMINIFYILFLILFCNNLIAENTLYVLVHGTWAREEHWHKEGGDFFDTLASKCDTTDQVISFLWSGSIKDEKRKQAGFNLSFFLKQLEQTNKSIVVIAHSHGGNVVFHALEILNKKNIAFNINCLILFGTPLLRNYNPPMHMIDVLLNIFSFKDIFQCITNNFCRILPNNPKIINVSCKIDYKEPKHTELHLPIIAFNIPTLYKNIIHIQKLTMEIPHCLEFYSKKPFKLIPETNRYMLLAKDLIIQKKNQKYFLKNSYKLKKI